MILSAPLSVLQKRAEFLAVAASGKKWVTLGVIVQLGAGRGDANPARYGLTASKKVGMAVERNRARRRLRALAREILASHAAPGHDYVLIARATTVTRAYADLRRDLVKSLKGLGVWREQNG